MARGSAAIVDTVEQAIFTSARTERGGGYQIVASSPGVVDQDVRALSTWCPSHDSMLETRCTATSVNFHLLPTGTFCVSRTETAGAEYSERGGRRLHTHCLIVAAETLQRFSNNPFALLRAAVAGGMLQISDPIPKRLAAVRLPGRAATVDRTVVTRLGQELGPERLRSLLHAALTAGTLGLPCRHAERIIAALLNCIPVAARPEFPFSTGLRFSPRRPFRWTAVAEDRVAQRHLAQQFRVTVVDPHGKAPMPAVAAHHAWADFVATCVAQKQLSRLRAELDRLRPVLAAPDSALPGESWEQPLHAGVAVSP